MRVPLQFKSTQFRFAITYILITFVVLLFLNLYCSRISQDVFRSGKKSTMLEKCQITASEIANLEVLNTYTVTEAVSKIGGLNTSRIIVTDQDGLSIYDSHDVNAAAGKHIELQEITDALEKNNVFRWTYGDGEILSQAATPIIFNNTLIGCVYISEADIEQGAIIKSLQNNIFVTTLALEIVVIIISIVFYRVSTVRLRKIMAMIQIIREGDYSYQIEMGGNDELSILSREFNELIKKLQKSKRKRNQFVSDASHELKTPLASIKLLTDSILQNDMDTETIREFVSDIGNEADRLNRMSQKLLSLSHIESQADSDCEIVYMAPTVQKVVRMLSTVAVEQNITIRQNLKNDCPILILEDDLYQIVFNLVENGIKYNVPGGELEITLNRIDDNAQIIIKDTGLGIPEDALDHIFERFYRIDKARSRKSGGAGLGLAIVRNMVERNRGEIFVESKVSEGSTFTISFPCFDTEEDPF